jgi:hypothetical protein
MGMIGEVESVAVAAVPGGTGLKLALKLAPYIAFALLVGIILWQRGSINSISGERDLAQLQAKSLGDIVIADNKTIVKLGERQVDNDAIAAAVAKRLDSNRAQTEGQRQAIRNASNDPTVRDWANQPVPGSVRHVLENGGAETGNAPGGRSKP